MSWPEKLVLASMFGHLVRLFCGSSLKSWVETVKTNLRRDILDLWNVSQITKQILSSSPTLKIVLHYGSFLVNIPNLSWPSLWEKILIFHPLNYFLIFINFPPDEKMKEEISYFNISKYIDKKWKAFMT